MAQNNATPGIVASYSIAAAAMATAGVGTSYVPGGTTNAPDKPHIRQYEASRGTEGSMAYDEKLMDAKLEAVEARTETKFAQLLGEIKLIASSVSAVGLQIADVKSDVAGLKTDVNDVRTATAGIKWNFVSLGIALAATILGLFAYGAQMFELASGLVGAK